MAEFVERIRACKVVSAGELQGCSAEEVDALERMYSVRVPKSYRSFLETMGHNSGLLFRYDHWAATYDYVLELTKEEREDANRAGPVASRRLDEILGRDGLIILGRLGEQFLFLRCSESDDPTIHYFNNSTWETSQAYSSVIDWLNSICDECIDAIASGYFEEHPRGTSP